MDSHQICFFCCKSFKHSLLDDKDEDDKNNDEIKPNPKSNKKFDTSSPIKSNSTNQTLLQMSQYLKVPSNLVSQLKEQNDSVSSPFCEDCKEISDTLSNLCEELEVTKMKISYYLTRLTDRIIGIQNAELKDDDDDDQQGNKPEVQKHSDLQKIVHKKCLLKVRKHEGKASPQVRLTKIQVESGPDSSPRLCLEDTDKNYLQVVLEPDEHQIKTELSADDNPELHSCPFCNFTINCGNQMNSHITDQHSEQFASDTAINPESNSLDDSTVRQVNLMCDYCPMTLTSRSKKASHMKAVHLSKTSKRGVLKCDICGAMIGSANYSRHKRIQHPNYPQQSKHGRKRISIYKVTCDFCPLTFTCESNKETHMKAVHLRPSNPLFGRKAVKRCNICGAMVIGTNLSAHKKRRHNVGSELGGTGGEKG